MVEASDKGGEGVFGGFVGGEYVLYVTGPSCIFVGREGDCEDSGVIDPTEDCFDLFESTFGEKLVDAEHGVSGEGVEVRGRA